MAVHPVDQADAESLMAPLYRLDRAQYGSMVQVGLFDGAVVDLVDGLLVDGRADNDKLHRLNVASYARAVEAGLLVGEPVELLDGLLVEVSPQSPLHAGVIERLTRHLSGSVVSLRVQLPIEIPPDSMPEPDLALVANETSLQHHPRTALLVVEVSASRTARDRLVKDRLYAAADIPIYWVVDVPARTVEVRTEPGMEGYKRHDLYPCGSLVPVPAPGVGELDVAGLFAGFVD